MFLILSRSKIPLYKSYFGVTLWLDLYLCTTSTLAMKINIQSILFCIANLKTSIALCVQSERKQTSCLATFFFQTCPIEGIADYLKYFIWKENKSPSQQPQLWSYQVGYDLEGNVQGCEVSILIILRYPFLKPNQDKFNWPF